MNSFTMGTKNVMVNSEELRTLRIYLEKQRNQKLFSSVFSNSFVTWSDSANDYESTQWSLPSTS